MFNTAPSATIARRPGCRYIESSACEDAARAPAQQVATTTNAPRSLAELMRRKRISNHSAALHHKSHTLQLADISNGIAGNGNQIGEFPGFDAANAVAPAQHFGRVAGDGKNHIESRHSGLMPPD